MITISTAGFAVLLILFIIAFIGFAILMSQYEAENDKLKIKNELLKQELQPYIEKKAKQNKKQELKELLKEIEKEKRGK